MPRADHVVYVDESGDHSLTSIDPLFPVFVLAFCVFRISEYVNVVVPSVEQLKFDFFAHDMVVLHERDIRKATGPFRFLQNEGLRDRFQRCLTSVVENAPFAVVAEVIHKPTFRSGSTQSANPYHVALERCLDHVAAHILADGGAGEVSVVFEARGRREDAELRSEFERIMSLPRWAAPTSIRFEFVCAQKSSNSSGLQLADLVARPIGLNALRPDQPNRAWDLIRPKLAQ
jgi:hypothetical protein